MKLKNSDKRHINVTAGDIASCFLFYHNDKVVGLEEEPTNPQDFPSIFEQRFYT